ncbi:mannose-6-phosphate isomerase, class I [Microbacterium sp. 10M-3C3]|uniref:mannose-6-phosphate isomerase, class I n=1 Tax=Microbacterium sp. 10M-3C3 TaxID=2483401 RepID=UPI000F638EB1|nr:mannose-6-phosphate isomerase, class I [Microbacterium sp. 10M-3C3]
MLTRISNEPRDYAWGSTTLLAELEGRDPSGRPEAEIWFGDHPGSPARVPDADTTLDRWLPAHAARLGVAPRLPYLVKLLAAGAPLSIQAHPSKAQAEEGFAREEAAGPARDAATRNYRDDNHKPELIVAVSATFEALAGLRPLSRTRELVAALGDAPGVAALAARLAGEDDAGVLREALGWLLSAEASDDVDGIIRSLAGAEAPAFAAELALARSLGAAYPGDPGVVVALLMNLVVLRRGEAIFVPAGVLHAYVSGLGIEVMAASDNVLRGGLTPKHIDVAELLHVVDTRPSAPPVLEPRTVSAGVRVFDPGVPDFTVVSATIDDGSRAVAFAGVAVAVAVEGIVEVTGAAGDRITLQPGQALVATPEESPLALAGEGTAFVAMPGAASA